MPPDPRFADSAGDDEWVDWDGDNTEPVLSNDDRVILEEMERRREAEEAIIQELQVQAEKFGGRLSAERWSDVQLLAHGSDEPLGGVAAYKDNKHGNNTVFVDTLWVDDSMQGKGVATFLMGAFEELAIIQGFDKARLIASGKGDLVSFYTKLGYHREDDRTTAMVKNLAPKPPQEAEL